MSHSVSFQNPVYSPDSKPETDTLQKKPPLDDSEAESDGIYDDEDSVKSFEPLDFSALNRHKLANDQSLHRIGPVPIAESKEFISSAKQIAILSKNADGVKFEELQKILTSGGQGRVVNQVSLSACDALLSYFFEIGNQGNNAQIDYHFLDNLFTGDGVANLGYRDSEGQSVMHVVVREWCTDLAFFLLHYGAEVDMQDKYGRTPLFVAASVNYTKMVAWLLDHDANINHRTINGEGQMVIHYAAKYGSLNVLQLLIERGANPDERDDQWRTPIFEAARYGHTNIVRYLLDLEVPVGSFSIYGEMALSHIINVMPTDVAMRALDQLIEEDSFARKVKFYIGNVTTKRWKRLCTIKHSFSGETMAKEPLEDIVDRCDLELLRHPAIIKSMSLRRHAYGKFWLGIESFFHVMLTLVCTVSNFVGKYVTSSMPHSHPSFVLWTTFLFIAEFMIILRAINTMYDLYLQNKHNTDYREWKTHLVRGEYRFCHPCWPVEEQIVKSKESSIKSWKRGKFSAVDSWMVIDILLTCIFTFYFIASIMWWLHDKNVIPDAVWTYLRIPLLLLVWLGLNRPLMYLQALGPFIQMLGQTVSSTAQFAFLFLEFLVPFVCGIWITFGRPGEEGAVYDSFTDTVYQVYLTALVYNYEYEQLEEVSKIMAQLLVGAYLLLVSCICINLFIALLSEAFARIQEDAIAITYLVEARRLLLAERKYGLRRKHSEYLFTHCSPLVEDGLLQEDKIVSAVSLLKEATNKLSNFINDALDIKDGCAEQLERLKKSLSRAKQFKEMNEELSEEIPVLLQKTQSDFKSFVPTPIRVNVNRYKKKGIRKALIEPLKEQTLAGYETIKRSFNGKMNGKPK